ncbi:hypothetical protein [Thermococcus sp.]
MGVANSKPVLYVPKGEDRDVWIQPRWERVEFIDKETGEIWYRDLEGYVQEKIWDIGDKDPLLAHVLEAMYIELRAMKEKLLKLEEKLEECDGRG